MTNSPYEFIRRIQFPAYFVVAFLSIGSMVEVLVGSWPIHAHDVNWRLSLLSSAAGATGTELLALLIFIVMGQVAASRPALFTAFACCVAGALGYLAAAATFGLDCLQIGSRVPANAVGRFDVTIGWALVRFGVAEIVCLALAGCALAAARALHRESPRDTANKIIIGVSGVASPGPRLTATGEAPPRQGARVGS